MSTALQTKRHRHPRGEQTKDKVDARGNESTPQAQPVGCKPAESAASPERNHAVTPAMHYDSAEK
jgi:hypothetical protein